MTNRITKLQKQHKIPLDDIRAVASLAKVVRASEGYKISRYDFHNWTTSDGCVYQVFISAKGTVAWGCQVISWKEVNSFSRKHGWWK